MLKLNYGEPPSHIVNLLHELDMFSFKPRPLEWKCVGDAFLHFHASGENTAPACVLQLAIWEFPKIGNPNIVP